MLTNIHESFLQLVRLGVGVSKEVTIPKDIEWDKLKVLADEHGLSEIILDGIEHLPDGQRPPQILLLEWIGETLQEEAVFATQQKEAAMMAELFHQNHIRTYVLKGTVVAECYPKPNYHVSVDVDCFLLPDKGDFDAWTLGNDLIVSKGYEVSKDFYKNSTFLLPDLTVECHQYLTPFRGNKNLKALEKVFQTLLCKDNGEDRFEETWLYRPPVMVSALFLIEHAYSHFLHEGLTWRMVLDWVLFSKKYEEEINCADFDAFIDEFGFHKFYESFSRLGQYLVGEFKEPNGLSVQDKRMLEDVWAPLDVHETVRGVKGKLALAGNTWRARWKYRYFTEMSWVTALWIQVRGFLFEKNPTLN